MQQGVTAPAEPAATAPLRTVADITSVPVTRPVSDTQRFAAALDPATPSAPRVTPLTERLAPEPDDVVTADADDLWSAVLARQPHPLSLLALYPDEPAFN